MTDTDTRTIIQIKAASATRMLPPVPTTAPVVHGSKIPKSPRTLPPSPTSSPPASPKRSPSAFEMAIARHETRFNNQPILPYAIKNQASVENITAILSYLKKIDHRHKKTGNTVLHIAAYQADINILKILLKDSRIIQMLHAQNNKGYGAVDLAIIHNKIEHANLLGHLMGLNKYDIEAKIESMQINYSQNHIIPQLRTWLELKIKQEPHLYLSSNDLIHYRQGNERVIQPYLDRIEAKGMCNGFSFMFSEYAANKKIDSFLYILKRISQWDGTETTLHETINHPTLGHKYKNLDDVFNQFSNDLIWFMHSGDTMKDISKLEQYHRTEQHQCIENNFGLEINNHGYYRSKTIVDSVRYLQQKHNKNLIIDMAFERALDIFHTVTLTVSHNETILYDCNNRCAYRSFASPEDAVNALCRYYNLDKLEGMSGIFSLESQQAKTTTSPHRMSCR